MPSVASPLGQLREAGGYFVTEPRARIHVTGSDRLRYLNGQVSNDLRKIEPGVALHALVLTVKGRLCADVFIWNDGEQLLVDTEAAQAEPLLARLERYAIADDVAFELSAPDAVYHVFGPASSAVEGVQIFRLGVEGKDAVAKPSGVAEASSDEAEILRIERGVPRWGTELSEDTLPQEAGLEKDAVDFKKGCYVGQEVVSRIQSVGHANRALCGFIGDFAPGTPANLFDASKARVGWLTSSRFHPELRKTVALGYLNVRAEGSSFSVEDESGACLGRAERSEFPLIS